jgi:hypothetical protein
MNNDSRLIELPREIKKKGHLHRALIREIDKKCVSGIMNKSVGGIPPEITLGQGPDVKVLSNYFRRSGMVDPISTNPRENFHTIGYQRLLKLKLRPLTISLKLPSNNGYKYWGK